MRKCIYVALLGFIFKFTGGALWSQNSEEGASRSHPESEKPKIFAVVCGVANYKNDQAISDLNFTDDDAYRVYAFLKSCKGGCVEDDNIAVLVDEAAGRSNILGTMDKIFSKAGPADMLWFYFSGHGAVGAFVPYDFDGLPASFLTHDDIKNIFKKYNAKYKVVFADACHSGSLFPQAPQASPSHSRPDPDGTKVLIVLSSLPSETSAENRQLREGVFTYYMLKGLKGTADRDNNGVVTLEELFPYVKANVLNYTQNKQTPFIEGNAPRTMPLSFLK